MDWKKIGVVLLVLAVIGIAAAQVAITNTTDIEKELTATGKTTDQCDMIPIYEVIDGAMKSKCSEDGLTCELVPEKQEIIGYTTDGEGCPTGIYEIDNGILLERIIALEKRVEALEKPIGEVTP